MLLFVLRKIFANKWMVASLLIGVVLAVAMVTTIPIYSRGILTRLLVRDLQAYQESSGIYPGTVEVKGYMTLDTENRSLAGYDEMNVAINREVRRGIVVPILTSSATVRQNFLRVFDEDRPDDDPTSISAVYVEGLFDRVHPNAGRLPEPASEGPGGTATIEAVVTTETAAGGDLVLGRTYDLFPSRVADPLPVKVRVVGIVEMADPSDVYWSFSLRRHNDTLILREEDLRRLVLTDNPLRNLETAWVYTYDYQSLTSDDAAPMVSFIDQYTVVARRAGLSIRVPVGRILQEYLIRGRALTMTLWVLQVPLLLMIAFYLFMVSQILVDHERNEIALMKSRGAKSVQVFSTYVILGLLLSGIALLIGPFLGLFVCRILGASSGFLEFVRRKALPLEITGRAYFYAAVAAIVALLMMLFPALRASRTTIVHHKLRLTTTRRPLWKMLFLDVIFVGIASYGLYRYRERAQLIEIAGLEATELALDPILLFVSTLFILGLGLLFLRLYPPVVRLVYRLGMRRWAPAAFASLIQVGRGGGKDQYLMLFLILSISIGVYNADAARTLNRNVEERIRYNIGADIVLQEEWRQVAADGNVIVKMEPSFGMPMGGESEPQTGRYVEPAFRRFEELPDVDAATRVFYEPNATGSKFGGGSFSRVSLFAIHPSQFGRVAWFRSDLLPSHWYRYLNLLSESPAAALISRGLAEEAEIAPGDAINITWRDQPSTLYYVYAIVDYWPGYNPFSARYVGTDRHLVVVNLNYLQATTALEPYEVWLDVKEDVDTQSLYDSFRERSIIPTRFMDANQQVIAARNDPMLQGTNGTLSLGFLVSLGVCFVGFLLYWTFSIRERTLQFGLFRAMGMSRGGIIAMLGIEQLLISGAAIAAGFGIGRLTGVLFVPLLQVIRNAEETVPPLRVISLQSDQLRIVLLVAAMLLLGFSILSVYLYRIRIHQAVKLGEE